MIYKIFVFTLLLCLIGCGESVTKDKVVFVDSLKLFEEFEMKLEYDKILERELKQESLLVDSINVLITNSADSVEIYKYRKDYYIAEQLFNSKFEKLSGEYTNLVMEKLNLYIKDYALENQCDFVLSGGNGSILYVNEGKNITEELIKYVNNKFHN